MHRYTLTGADVELANFHGMRSSIALAGQRLTSFVHNGQAGRSIDGGQSKRLFFDRRRRG